MRQCAIKLGFLHHKDIFSIVKLGEKVIEHKLNDDDHEYSFFHGCLRAYTHTGYGCDVITISENTRLQEHIKFQGAVVACFIALVTTALEIEDFEKKIGDHVDRFIQGILSIANENVSSNIQVRDLEVLAKTII